MLKFLATVGAVLGISTGATSTVPTMPVHCVNIVHTLAVGSTGVEVVALQGFLGVKVTGYFGPLTKSTLIKWQISNHIVISASSIGAGQVGPKTRAMMACKPTETVPSPISVPPPPKATTSVQTSIPPPPPPPVQPLTSGSGAASNSGGVANQCKSFTTPKPPDSQCQWQWQLIRDEAGCPEQWDCSDPDNYE